MYEDAVQTALNALTLLEEHSPGESTQLRRMLPALAVSFARAGNHLTEKGMLGLVAWAKEEDVPLSSLFNHTKGHVTSSLTYNQIMKRLRPDFGKPLTADQAIAHGRIDIFMRHEAKFTYGDAAYSSLAKAAAGRGQTDFCRHLIGKTCYPLVTLSAALAEGVKQQQHHLIYTLLSETADEHSDTVESGASIYLSHENSSNYQGFLRLYRDFKKSAPNVKPDYFTGLEAWQNVPLRLKPYLQVREMILQETINMRDANKAAFKAVLLFQSKENVLRFLDRWGRNSAAPLSKLLKDIEPPVTRFVDWPSWGDALIKYGPQMNFAVQFAQQLTTPARNRQGNISLRLTRQTIWDKYFPHDHKYGPVAALCFEHESRLIILEDSLNLWKNAARQDPATRNAVPSINIACDDASLAGYKLEKISYKDPRILFLGHYSGCCEKMGDHFEPTIVHALTTRKSGFYVLTKDNEIRGHTWVWRGEGRQLIIDGWETKDPAIGNSHLVTLTGIIAEELSSPDYDAYKISDILLGRCSSDFTVEESFEEAHEVATRHTCERYYMDELPDQWLVKRLEQPEKYAIYAPACQP